MEFAAKVEIYLVNISRAQPIKNISTILYYKSPLPLVPMGNGRYCGGVGQSEGWQAHLLTGGKLGFRARKQTRLPICT